MRNHKSGATARRGATLVLVAVLILVTGGMAAFAIDLARVYNGVNELQTAADASALAAAERVMRGSANPVAVTQTFGATNNAFGTPVSLAAGDIEGGFWDPAAATFTPSAWSAANSVRVTTSRSTGLSFGRLLGLASLTPTRRAIAWIGNQASRDCIKPLGIDLTYMNSLLSPYDLTTQAGVAQLASLTNGNNLAGQQQMTVVIGPSVTNPPGNPNIAPSIFSALTGANSSRKEYINALRDQSCDAVADYSLGTQEIRMQPGNGGGDVAAATVDGLDPVTTGPQNQRSPGTCGAPRNNDATCYDPVTGTAGVTVTVAVVTPVSQNSVNLNSFVSFRIMCLYRGGNQPGSGSSSERCPWLTAMGRTDNNYVEGTIVGFPMVATAVTGNGNSLGNTISASQKLVLVQ